MISQLVHFERRKSYLYDDNTLEKTITHVGDYEKIEIGNDTYEVHYNGCGEGLVAMNVRTNGGQDEIYYTYTDHLGSILTVTDENANIIHDQSFDPWGRKRNPVDWTYNNIDPTPPWLIRGYTYHEQMDEFDLINMNGRVYDPVVSRMLSTDNYVQEPGNSQSYNRYSYVWNNPLKLTDPSGDIAWYAPALIGAGVGFYIGASTTASNGFKGNPANWGDDFLEAGIVGAIYGAGVGLSVSAAAGKMGYDVGLKTSNWANNPWFDTWSNALLTANINVTSSLIQGRELNEAAASGLVGLGSGLLGGYFGYKFGNGQRLHMPKSFENTKLTNYITASLNGFGDRFVIDQMRGNNFKHSLKEGLFGLGEGLYTAHFIGNNSFFGDNFEYNGRILSNFSTQAITSVPGAGMSIATYHLAGYTHAQFWKGWANLQMWRILPSWLTGTGIGIVPISNNYIFPHYNSSVVTPYGFK